MPKWLIWIGIIAGTLVLLTLVGTAMLPSEYLVERSVEIEASAADVHRMVEDLEKWPEWAPWMEKDPSIKMEYGAQTVGIGANQRWTGKDGTGELTIVSSSRDSGVAYELSFNDGAMESVGELLYETTEAGVRVTWRMEGAMGFNPIHRLFVLMMDEMVGPDFEAGLEKLRQVAESSATGSSDTPSAPEEDAEGVESDDAA